MHDATDIRAQLEQERRLIEGATEGPWAYEPESVGPNGEWYRPARAYVEIESHGPDGVEGDELTLGGGSPEDAAFIAHARTALPVRNAQIEAVLALHRKKVRTARMKYYCGHCGDEAGWPCPTVRAIEEAGSE